MAEPLLRARNLCKTFAAGTRGGESVKAVHGIDLDIARGETLAVVGESGCGKTTLGRMLALLLAPSSGELRIDGQDVAALNRRALKPLRKQVQMVFQDPVASLNPRHTVEAILTEPMSNFGYSALERTQRATAMLDDVGLASADLKRYPHEFSGGQRQRITLARALMLNPPFIVADEPVSALDVSVQSQILNLLVDLRDKHALTYLFISHDLAVVHHLADRVAVMYLGQIVEMADRATLFTAPAHPYTRALLASVPAVTPVKTRMGRVLSGDPPSPLNPPSGCHFHPRCPHATDTCRTVSPVLEPHNTRRQLVACHHHEAIS